METSNPILIGIDPGIALTGYGILKMDSLNHQPQVLEYGVIRTPAGMELSQRLQLLYEKLSALLKKYNPSYGGCEKVFYSKNIKTATAVNQARGVILLALQQAHVKLTELTPTQIKLAVTGYGSAEKSQVQYMTQNILKLKDRLTQDDAADALAVAIATTSLISQPAIV